VRPIELRSSARSNGRRVIAACRRRATTRVGGGRSVAVDGRRDSTFFFVAGASAAAAAFFLSRTDERLRARSAAGNHADQDRAPKVFPPGSVFGAQSPDSASSCPDMIPSIGPRDPSLASPENLADRGERSRALTNKHARGARTKASVIETGPERPPTPVIGGWRGRRYFPVSPNDRAFSYSVVNSSTNRPTDDPAHVIA